MKDLPPSVSTYWRKHRVWDRYQEEQHPVIGQALREQRELVVAAVRGFAETRTDPITVADLGCGTGSVANDLMSLSQVQSLLAVDISEQALEKVRTRAAQLGTQAKLRTLSGDFYGLNWPATERFDVVVCMDVLHHLPDIPRMLAIIRDRLRPDGMFVGNIRAQEGTATFFRRYGPIKRALIGIQPAVDRALPANSWLRRWLGSIGYFRIRTFRRAEAEKSLREAGFDIQRVESGYYHWFICGR